MDTAAQLQQLFRTLTPAQINAALRAVHVSHAAARTSLTVPAISHGRVEKKTVKLTPVAKATRPLNSWMAFRSYYSAIFSNLPQKDISGFLTYMWRADPFKAKWSVLAKAYSVVRDEHGKYNVPLDAFLAINGPLLGIVESQNYLQHLGWQVAVCADGETILRRGSIVMDEETFRANVSVNDVVINTYQAGLCVGDVSKVLLKNDETALSTQRTTKMADSHKTLSIRRKKLGSTARENTAPMTLNGTENNVQNNTVIGTHLTQDNNSIVPSNNIATASSSRGLQAQDNNGTHGSAHGVIAAHGPLQRADNRSINGQPQNAVEQATTTSSVALTSTLSRAPQTHQTATQVQNAPGLHATTSSTGAVHNNNNSITNPPATMSSETVDREENQYNSAFDPLEPAYVFDPFNGNEFDAFDISGVWDSWMNPDAFA